MGSSKVATRVIAPIDSPGFQSRTRTGITESSKKTPVCKYLLLFLFCIATALLFHPKLLNIRLPYLRYPRNEEVSMNYVESFHLWTKSAKDSAQDVIVGLSDHLAKTYFKPRQTFILIPGFLCTGFEEWIILMKNALLKRSDCNVISVNWSSGSKTIGYYVIQERVPYVGEDVAALITFLKSEGLREEQVHLIGHSLGAHISGFSGKLFGGKLPRITGLDPAGVGYWGVSSSKRLDKSDAMFVDVVHTHSCYTILNQWTDCYGIIENIGHADFWPNGGERQPPCIDGDGEEWIKEGSNCHHGIAYAYYIESIQYYPTSTHYAARKCDSYEDYNNISCQYEHPIQYMGFNVQPGINGTFYLNTSNIYPYARLDPNYSPRDYSFLRILGFLIGVILAVYAFLSTYYQLDL